MEILQWLQILHVIIAILQSHFVHLALIQQNVNSFF